MTTERRTAVVVVLMLLAVFVLHPACPPEPAHHGAVTPGVAVDFAGEFCHHGDVHHLSAAAPAPATVQAGPVSAALPDFDDEPGMHPATPSRSCQRLSEPSRSGRTLLLDLGISRT
jgi:hypothetical protein